jgi:hypothetical protein
MSCRFSRLKFVPATAVAGILRSSFLTKKGAIQSQEVPFGELLGFFVLKIILNFLKFGLAFLKIRGRIDPSTR